MNIVFLDRDGVINAFPGHGRYVTKIKEFHFLPGALEAIRILTQAQFTIFVISNQAGVSKRIFSAGKLRQITEYMLRHVERQGGRIRQVFYCTHASSAGCSCRKPEIGMIQRALKVIRRDRRILKNTFLVGDAQSDIETGVRAGCKTILVLSGKESREDVRRWQNKPDHIVRDLKEAVRIIDYENLAHSRFGRSRTQKSG